MSLWENIKMAFDAIRAHKMRSILTMLGIVIGVSSVIVIVAIGQGGEAKLSESFTGSANTITINASSEVLEENNYEAPPGFFTQRDIQDLNHLNHVDAVVTRSFEMGSVFYQTEEVEGAFINGMNNNEPLAAENREIGKGRLLTESDFQGGNPVAVITPTVEKALFKDKESIGQLIRIGNQPLQVVGVLQEAEGLFTGLMGDDSVYLPDKIWNRIYGENSIGQLTLKVTDAKKMKEVGDLAISKLESNHNTEGDYEVQNLEEITEGISKVTNIMTIVIGSIGSISLLVGGIGVMNIMLVSVTERTREIGIRQSLGATRANILVQFLTESVTLSLLGGLIGLSLGAAIAGLVNFFSPLPALVSFPVAIGAVLFSMLFGVLFGILPANKASRLSPIECLRRD